MAPFRTVDERTSLADPFTLSTLLSKNNCTVFNALRIVKMAITYEEKSTPAYPHEQISPSGSRDGQEDLEAGDKGVKVGEKEFERENENSSTEGISTKVELRRRQYSIYWKLFHLAVFVVMTGYAIAFVFSKD